MVGKPFVVLLAFLDRTLHIERAIVIPIIFELTDQ